MKRFLAPLFAALTLASLAAAPGHVGRELKTVESSAEVVHAFSAIPLHAIPTALLRQAAGVAIIPHVFKVGLVLSERFGRGVVLVHQPDGHWSHPIFVTLSGRGIGGQAGIQSTDLVLVFKSRKSLDRALTGHLTLGTDVAVAAGPVGREADAASDRFLRTEIFSWSRSRGLFAGVSVEGARLAVDPHANEAFYHIRGCRPADVLAFHGAQIASVEALKEQLYQIAPPSPPLPAFVPAERAHGGIQ
jgi:lipid-binding SYLF domain-containing protein